jgi:hypothetical protein
VFSRGIPAQCPESGIGIIQERAQGALRGQWQILVKGRNAEMANAGLKTIAHELLEVPLISLPTGT